MTNVELINNSNSFLYLSNFIDMLAAERSVANNTLLAYKNDILGLYSYLKIKNLRISSLENDHLLDYINYLGGRSLSGKTIARKISAIRQFYHFLASDKVSLHNPAVNIVMPKRGFDLPKPISKDAILLLIKTANNNTTYEGIRTSAMLEILYATGLRISELITLKIQSLERNINDKTLLHYILVRGKGNKERIVLLNIEAVSALEKYISIRQSFIKLGAKTDWLFPSVNKFGKVTHLTRQRFGQILKELAVNSGVDPKLVSPHKIRHSFATHMLQNGANLRIVQELLGHADISSTQIYTKVSNNKAKEVLFNKHPLNNS